MAQTQMTFQLFGIEAKFHDAFFRADEWTEYCEVKVGEPYTDIEGALEELRVLSKRVKSPYYEIGYPDGKKIVGYTIKVLGIAGSLKPYSHIEQAK